MIYSPRGFACSFSARLRGSQPQMPAMESISHLMARYYLRGRPGGDQHFLSPRTPQVRGEGGGSRSDSERCRIPDRQRHTRRHHPSIHIVERAVPPLSVTVTRAVLVFVRKKRPQNDKSTHRDWPTATVPFLLPKCIRKARLPSGPFFFPQQTTCGVRYRHFGSCGHFPAVFYPIY